MQYVMNCRGVKNKSGGGVGTSIWATTVQAPGLPLNLGRLQVSQAELGKPLIHLPSFPTRRLFSDIPSLNLNATFQVYASA